MNDSAAIQDTETTSRIQQVFDKQRTASRRKPELDLNARLESLDKLEKMVQGLSETNGVAHWPRR